MTPLRIAIADDHALLRQSLRSVLDNKSDFDVVFDAANGIELLEKLAHNSVDIVILDLEMPVMGGFEALIKINQQFPAVKCLIVSYFFEPDFVVNALKNGAKGFISKNSAVDVIKKALTTIYCGNVYLTEEFSYLTNSGETPQLTKADHPFTNKEMAIIRLICAGKTNKEIAKELYIAVKTVENHRSNIFIKAGVKNVAQLVIFAVHRGIVVTI
jgi:DNA-binding NarL/FixJ family response regulator